MIVRPARESDMAWVKGTWFNSQIGHYRNPQHGHKALARHFMREVVSRSPTIAVLASGENNDTLHAWACASPGELHYAYVPRDLRGNGFGRRCIAAALGEYPDRIVTSYRWPFPSNRFVFQPLRLAG